MSGQRANRTLPAGDDENTVQPTLRGEVFRTAAAYFSAYDFKAKDHHVKNCVFVFFEILTNRTPGKDVHYAFSWDLFSKLYN